MIGWMCIPCPRRSNRPAENSARERGRRKLGVIAGSRGVHAGFTRILGSRATFSDYSARTRARNPARTSVMEYHSGGIKIEANANRRTGSPPRHPARFILPG